jgi:DNA-binding transcriptional regulator GbsR (MarR family)
MTYLEAVSQASQALTPRDTYNATRNAVSAAAKDANAEFLSRVSFDSKLQEDVRKAAQGDKDAQKRIDDIRNKIQQDTFRTYQVQGVDLSSGRMGPAPTAGGGGGGRGGVNDPLGIR